MGVGVNYNSSVVGCASMDSIAADLAKRILVQQLEFTIGMLHDDPDTVGPAAVRRRLVDCKLDVEDIVSDWTSELESRIRKHLNDNLIINVKTVTYDAEQNALIDAEVFVRQKEHYE
jgi:hypothetical protein